MLIRWALQRGTSALPKSTRPERIRSNLDVFDWRLDQPDFDRLSQLATQLRMVDGSIWLHPQGPYRSLAELWDDPDEDGREARYVESLYERGVQLPVVELGPGGCGCAHGLLWPSPAALVKHSAGGLTSSTVLMMLVWWLCCCSGWAG